MQSPMRDIYYGELLLRVFSLRYLAEKLGRSPITVRIWEFRRVIPPPMIRSKSGLRWYTKEEVDLYVRLAEEEQLKNGANFAKTKFTKRAFCEVEVLRRKLVTAAEKAKGDRK